MHPVSTSAIGSVTPRSAIVPFLIISIVAHFVGLNRAVTAISVYRPAISRTIVISQSIPIITGFNPLLHKAIAANRYFTRPLFTIGAPVIVLTITVVAGF